MSKALDVYQKRLSALSTKVDDLAAKYVSAARSTQSIEGMFSFAVEAIGDRVTELKNGGHQGTKLADFRDDVEVKEQLKALVGLTGLGKHYETILGLKKPNVKITEEQGELVKDLLSEIKKLEKSKDSALAGFQELLKEVRKLPHSATWGHLDTLKMAKPESLDLKSREKSNIQSVQQAIDAAKAGPVVKKPMEIDEAKAKLQLRHAEVQADKAKQSKDQIDKLCTAALAVGDVAQAKTLLTKAAKVNEELRDIVATNKKALKASLADPSNPALAQTLKRFSATETMASDAAATLAQAVRVVLRPASTPGSSA